MQWNVPYSWQYYLVLIEVHLSIIHYMTCCMQSRMAVLMEWRQILLLARRLSFRAMRLLDVCRPQKKKRCCVQCNQLQTLQWELPLMSLLVGWSDYRRGGCIQDGAADYSSARHGERKLLKLPSQTHARSSVQAG